MANSDSVQVLRQLPIVVGTLGGSLLLINRLLTPTLVESQSRSDALGIILSALLVLTGLLWQRVQPKPPEAVELIGEQRFELLETLPEAVRAELAWASKLLLTNTVTRSVVVWQGRGLEHGASGGLRGDRQLLRRGILPERTLQQPGPIVQRVLNTQKPVYLVDLKLFPGRIEFDYLPENTQGVICQPLGEIGVMILAANVPRSYTQQDENWIRGIAEKLSVSLMEIPTETPTETP